MKKTVRRGIFETNSSMSHSLVIATKEDMKKWESGKLFYDWRKKQLVTKEEMERVINNPDNFYDRSDFESYDEFITGGEDWYSFETSGGTYTTPNGEELEWVAAYGRNG